MHGQHAEVMLAPAQIVTFASALETAAHVHEMVEGHRTMCSTQIHYLKLLLRLCSLAQALIAASQLDSVC